MSSELAALLAMAALIGFIHTLVGPDHYVPFIMLAASNRWSRLKTAVITVLCGIGHVGSSVVLGLIGVALGIALNKLDIIESVRGEIAGWTLIGFGLAYTIWGLRRAWKNRPHTHGHFHRDGDEHSHEHCHHEEHTHVHQPASSSNAVWALFIIFVFGPCEPLIPILMYPAAKGSMMDVVIVAGVFSVVTISTMLATVLLGTHGIHLLPVRRVERYMHAIAGSTILACGCAIQFLGL
jgi:nickel/cobalt transporter (NicO) family protein